MGCGEKIILKTCGTRLQGVILLLSPVFSCLLSPVSSHISSCVRPSIISVATPAVKTGRAMASGSWRRIWGANYFDGPLPPSCICRQRRYRASAADTRDAGFNYLSNVDIVRVGGCRLRRRDLRRLPPRRERMASRPRGAGGGVDGDGDGDGDGD